jgi:hypothetical protein
MTKYITHTDVQYITFKSHHNGKTFEQVGILVVPTILHENAIEQFRNAGVGFRKAADSDHLVGEAIVFKKLVICDGERKHSDYVVFLDRITDLEYIDEMTYNLLTS